jgi:hypothetical protein
VCFALFISSLKWIEESFSAVPALYAKLQDVRDENMRHSQYVTAMENLKHIFTVPESVEKTKQWISEGKLLHTHQVECKPGTTVIMPVLHCICFSGFWYKYFLHIPCAR